MTLMGKILTFLILIMSLVFMMFTLATYASHRNWRDDYAKLKTENDGARAEVDRQNGEIAELNQKLQRERAGRSEALATKESRNKGLTEELADLNKKHVAIMREHRKNIETVGVAQRQMEKFKNELVALRGDFQNILTDRNSQLSLSTELADRVQDTIGQLATSVREADSLRTSLGEAVLKVETLEVSGGAGGINIAGQAALDLDGRVRRVGNDDLVVVTLGSDEGLNRGDKLDVWRSNGTYIGRLEVVETKTDSSVAKIVRKFLRGTIRQGDIVETKLLSS